MADTVPDHVVALLADWGVDTIFGLPGDGINGFVEALHKAKDRIRYIHCRHEETAALAASGYAKFTGQLGVCFSTAAPGAVHLLNGLYDAKIDGAPVLAITGMTYHDLIGTHYLQDINQDYLYQDVALCNQRIMGPAHVENVLNLACRAALSNRGVAHVAVPIDIQAMPASQERRFKRNVPGHSAAAWQPPRRVPEPVLIECAVDPLEPPGLWSSPPRKRASWRPRCPGRGQPPLDRPLDRPPRGAGIRFLPEPLRHRRPGYRAADRRWRRGGEGAVARAAPGARCGARP